MASSSSTSPTAATLYSYDVFINHRGPDVKKTFASYLYRRLIIHGLRVFLDQPELQWGDDLTPQICGAIDTASVQVAIFSPTYAQSTWCLNELVLMLDTLEKGATILPVFYNVKPSELRWNRGENGLYAESLLYLENKKTGEGKSRHDPVIIENWRNALSRLAEKSGFELAKYNGDEGELLDEVVERVLKKVKKPGLEVAKYPTGLDDKMEDFETTVLMPQRQSGKPQILGIAGLGGVGKTTLAKEIFNRKNSDYGQFSCFLFDVRENAAKGCLHLLQRKLMKCLTGGTDIEIDNIDEGTGMLRNHLSSSKALVVLDDVDEVQQVDALFPVRTVPHPDSLILITSRRRDVLRGSRVEESSIYNLSGLNTEHSQELFCFHSFSQPHPLPGFEGLVDKFLKACDGLPLSLIVFGALVYGNNEPSYWEEQLHKLQRILPAEIKERLKISYDALDVEEQHIFLDIACFFIGQNRDTAIRIWEGSVWNGRLGFRNLENRCLVKVDSGNCIHMHDHLRDLGRDIAEAPGLPLRLWRGMENILQQSSNEDVIREVRGIRMIGENNNSDDHLRDLARDIAEAPGLPLRLERGMENILQLSSNEKVIREVRGIRMIGENNNSDDQLACFSWCLFGSFLMKLCNILHNRQDPFHCIRISKLQLLDAQDALLESLFRRVEFPNLLWLRWKVCPYSSMPSWIPMKNLRVLQVESDKLETLWQVESQAPLHLRVLEISSPLSRIPKSIGQLKHLERIVVSGGRQVILPEEFCLLQSLKILVLENCSEMKALPDCFGNLTTLPRLELFGCKKLERLPNSFGNLSSLKYFSLEGCSNVTMSSDTFGNICTLEYMCIQDCEKIEVLPQQVAQQKSLERLYLRLPYLKELPSAIGELSHLEELKLERSDLDELLPSLGELRNLKKLASNLDSSIEQCMPRLQKLHLWLTKISKLSFSAGVCPNLQYLEVMMCSIVEIGTLPNTLVILSLAYCGDLRKIKGLCGLANLQKLTIPFCSALEELPSVETLISLEKLNAEACDKLKTIRGLGCLTKLKELFVGGCCELEELPGVEDVRSLVNLDVSECPKLQLPSVETLISLEKLNAEACHKLKTIRGLGCLTKLKELYVGGCSELEELPGVEDVRSLVELDVSECPKLQWKDGVLEQLHQRVKDMCRAAHLKGTYNPSTPG